MSGVFFRAAQSRRFAPSCRCRRLPRRPVSCKPGYQLCGSVRRLWRRAIRGGAVDPVHRRRGVLRVLDRSLLLMRTRFQEKRELVTAPFRRRLADGVSVFIRIHSCAQRC